MADLGALTLLDHVKHSPQNTASAFDVSDACHFLPVSIKLSSVIATDESSELLHQLQKPLSWISSSVSSVMFYYLERDRNSRLIEVRIYYHDIVSVLPGMCLELKDAIALKNPLLIVVALIICGLGYGTKR